MAQSGGENDKRGGVVIAVIGGADVGLSAGCCVCNCFFSMLRIITLDSGSDDTDDSAYSGLFLFFRSRERGVVLLGLCLNKQINIYI